MASSQVPNDIILFHYPTSPYARRIVWYLTLRNIPYAQCLQPVWLPRPDLSALGIAYRRIPLLSIGGSVYADTRLILAKLDTLFPASPSHPALSTPASKGLEQLLSSFTVGSGVFSRAAQLIPTHLPMMRDPRFIQDRTNLTGQKFSPEALDRVRPEALAHMRRLWDVYEDLLADGRPWIAGSDAAPTRADIEAVWPLHWMVGLKSLPDELFGATRYPRTNAWVQRFRAALKDATKRHPEAAQPVTVDGDKAFAFITSTPSRDQHVLVETDDPTGFKQGQHVLVWPIETGFNQKDKGTLVGLTKDEVVVAVKTERDPSKEILLHAPRLGFRIVPASPAKL